MLATLKPFFFLFEFFCTKKLKKSSKIQALQRLSDFEFSDNIEENQRVTGKKTSSIILQETQTPLLDSLMKRRRIREYKEKTLLIQNNMKKS